MKILNEQDEEITEEQADLNLGYLKQDYVLIQFHEATEPVGEVGHTRVIVTFSDGTTASFDHGYPLKYFDEDKNFKYADEYEGKEGASVDEEYIIDSPYQPGEPEWYENEEILRYVLYTQEELDQIAAQKEQQEQQAAEEQARIDRYNQLLSTVDDMTLVMAESVGTYSETESQVGDLTLAMADIIGG